MSYDALLNWCRQQAAYFAPFICDVGAFLQQAHDSGKMCIRDSKMAVKPIKNGENVIKYGFPIGHATADAEPGTWMHTHNVHTLSLIHIWSVGRGRRVSQRREGSGEDRQGHLLRQRKALLQPVREVPEPE